MNSTTTRLSGTPLRQTISYYGTLLVLGLFTPILGAALPELAAQTGSALNSVSILFTARAVGGMIGAYFSGRLYDRFSGHIVLSLVLFSMFLVGFGVPHATELWMLAALMFFRGLGDGGGHVGANTMLVWVHREGSPRYMNGLHLFFGIGAFISPIIVGQAIGLTGEVGWSFRIVALVTIPFIILLLRTPAPMEPPKRQHGQGSVAGPYIIFAIALFYFFYTGTEASFGGWITTYGLRQILGDPVAAATLASVFWGALTLGRFVANQIAKWFVLERVLVINLTGCIIGMILLYLFRASELMLWGGTFWVGFSMSSTFPTMMSLASSRLHVTGKTTSWFLLGATAGGMVLPLLIGQWFESVGPEVMIYMILASLFFAFLVLLFMIFPALRRIAHHT